MILTTPNGEFNVLFDLKPGAFRHWDHKFEWTRSEFQDWCNHICVRFPDYCVQFHGVGKAPEGYENLGCCSQLGLFIRKDFLESLNTEEIIEKVVEQDEPVHEYVECEEYKLIKSVEYPFFHDTRNRDEKIFDECSYHLNRFRWMEEPYFNYELDRFEIPIAAVANSCWQVSEDVDEIRSVLKSKYVIDGDCVIFPPNEEEESEIGDYEEMESQDLHLASP